uniref:Uncharacterized protein n=1 Tax=Magallana gigas TaxID=29159 RepID=K1QPT8_MAGGI
MATLAGRICPAVWYTCPTTKEGFENKIFTRLGEYGSKAIAAHFAMLSKNPDAIAK